MQTLLCFPPVGSLSTATVAGTALNPPDTASSTTRFGIDITSTGTINFEQQMGPGLPWYPVSATNENGLAVGTSTTASGIFSIDSTGVFAVRCNVVANGSGVIINGLTVKGGGGGGSGGAVSIGDGNDVAEGATTAVAYSDTTAAAPGTEIALLKGLFKSMNAAVTNTVQGVASYAGIPIPVKQVEHVNPVMVILLITSAAIGQTGEKLLTFTPVIDGVVGAGVTSYSVTSGKRARFLKFMPAQDVVVNNTTAVNAGYRIRANPAGAAVIGSQQIGPVHTIAGVNTNGTNYGPTGDYDYKGEYEFAGGTGIGITGHVPQRVVTTADPDLGGALVLMEYTP